MQKNLCKGLYQCFLFLFLFEHIVPGIILSLSSLLISFFVEQGGGLAKSKVRGRTFSGPECRKQCCPPSVFPCWNPALCDLGRLCVSVCLIVTCAYALQFSLAPLMLFSKSSQSSRTKWEGKQSFHMKRGQQNPGGGPC